jgi:hypothetical protein
MAIKECNSALHFSCATLSHEGHPKVLKLLVESEADTNAKNRVCDSSPCSIPISNPKDGDTPAHLASSNSPEILLNLLNLGADVTLKNNVS